MSAFKIWGETPTLQRPIAEYSMNAVYSYRDYTAPFAALLQVHCLNMHKWNIWAIITDRNFSKSLLLRVLIKSYSCINACCSRSKIKLCARTTNQFILYNASQTVGKTWRTERSIVSKLDVTGLLTLVVVVGFQLVDDRSSGPLHQKSCKQTTLSTLAVRNVITEQQRDLRVDFGNHGWVWRRFSEHKVCHLHIIYGYQCGSRKDISWKFLFMVNINVIAIPK